MKHLGQKYELAKKTARGVEPDIFIYVFPWDLVPLEPEYKKVLRGNHSANLSRTVWSILSLAGTLLRLGQRRSA